MGSLELFGALHSSPWPEYRGGAAFAGLISARARLAGGEGGVERLEEVALYLGVASDGVGGGRRGVVAGAVEAAAVSSDGGAPAANSGRTRAGEVHGGERKLARGQFERRRGGGGSSAAA